MATVVYEPGFSGPATINHGDSVTIDGPGGFGAKAQPGPQIWDDSSGPTGDGGLLDIWDGAWPDLSITPDNRIARRLPHRGVDPPHNLVGRYIAGVHNIEDFGTNGFNPRKGGAVSMWKAMPQAFPVDVYAHAWIRFDPAWSVPNLAPGRNNKSSHIKYVNFTTTWPGVGTPNKEDGMTFDYSQGAFPYNASSTSIKHKSYGDFGPAIYGGIGDCHNYIAAWGKMELFWHLASVGGTFRIFENGRQVYGRSLTFPAEFPPPDTSFVSLAIGDFARPYTSDVFWRYFTDCYIDNTFARVMLLGPGDFTGASAATAREVQVATAWTDASITFDCWQGAHTTLDNTQLYVVDANDSPTLVATLGPGGGPTPEAPTITSATAAEGTVGQPFEYQITGTDDPTSFDAHGLLE